MKLVEIIILIIFALLIGLLSGWDETNKYWEKKLIKLDQAHYHPVTREFVLRTNYIDEFIIDRIEK